MLAPKPPGLLWRGNLPVLPSPADWTIAGPVPLLDSQPVSQEVNGCQDIGLGLLGFLPCPITLATGKRVPLEKIKLTENWQTGGCGQYRNSDQGFENIY